VTRPLGAVLLAAAAAVLVTGLA